MVSITFYLVCVLTSRIFLCCMDTDMCIGVRARVCEDTHVDKSVYMDHFSIFEVFMQHKLVQDSKVRK